jgi:predicted transglutaminase-like cysteine proteinase
MAVPAAAKPAVIETPPLAGAALREPAPFDFGMFGSMTFRMANHRFAKDWHNVLKRHADQRATYENCGKPGFTCSARVLAWRKLVASLRGLPEIEQLKRLNRAVNRLIPFADDLVAHGKRDHWASPLEFLAARGDCEDYAILKFITLLELGFANDRLRVAVVRDRDRRVLHAVVTVDLDGRTLVLDSLADNVVEDYLVLHYDPIFSANKDKLFGHVVTRQLRLKFAAHIENRILTGASVKRAEREPRTYATVTPYRMFE